MLEAIARLRPELNPYLMIVGEGPERPRIEQRIRSLNLAASVKLTGQQDSAEPYYGIAQVAVLSSLSEGSPNALLEAMAAGVPVVATRVGGIPGNRHAWGKRSPDRAARYRGNEQRDRAHSQRYRTGPETGETICGTNSGTSYSPPTHV